MSDQRLQQSLMRSLKRQLGFRKLVTSYGHRFVRPGATVVVPMGSELVEGVLLDAAEELVPFRVLFVVPDAIGIASSNAAIEQANPTSSAVSGILHQKRIPIACVPVSALSFSLDPVTYGFEPALESTRLFPPNHTFVLTGASIAMSTGAVIAESVVGTVASAAKECAREVWVVTELGQCLKNAGLGSATGRNSGLEERKVANEISASLLTGYITEEGPCSVAAMVEESVKLGF